MSAQTPRGCPSPPGSSAPFPSPAGSGPLLQQRSGLPPLPVSRQPSLAAGLAAPGRSVGGPATSMAPSPADADQALSMHMQDALFVGSPAASPGSALAALQQASPHRRQSLFAALAPRGAAGEAGDHDVHSSHLLSGSLSCLEDGGAAGELLARHLSASHSGSLSGSGSMAGTADQLIASLRQQHSGWPAGSDAAGAQGGDVAALLGGAAAAAGSPTQCAAPLSPAGSAQRGLGDLGCDPSGDESAEPTRHLWIGNLGTRTPRQVLKTIFER